MTSSKKILQTLSTLPSLKEKLASIRKAITSIQEEFNHIGLLKTYSEEELQVLLRREIDLYKVTRNCIPDGLSPEVITAIHCIAAEDLGSALFRVVRSCPEQRSASPFIKLALLPRYPVMLAIAEQIDVCKQDASEETRKQVFAARSSELGVYFSGRMEPLLAEEKKFTLELEQLQKLNKLEESTVSAYMVEPAFVISGYEIDVVNTYTMLTEEGKPLPRIGLCNEESFLLFSLNRRLNFGSRRAIVNLEREFDELLGFSEKMNVGAEDNDTLSQCKH